MSFRSQLRQTGMLQSGTETRSTGGAVQVIWADVRDIRCLVNPVSASAFFKLGVTEDVTHIIYTEYHADLVAAPKGRWRLVVGAEKYEVVLPYDPAARHHHLELRCRRMD